MATIAVIGSGAVGAYYGACLARAGHHVRFLMRRDLDAVRARGLEIRSPNGNFHLDKVQAFGAPDQLGKVDWVLCSLKATAIDEARTLIAPCLREDTRVVALMNGLGLEDRLAEWFGGRRIFGAMAFVGINRGEPGVVHHLAYGRLSIGHRLDDLAELDILRQLLESGGLEVSVAPNLRYARWEKLCWNIPFNGLSVAAGGVGTRAIVDDDALARVAERAMREVIAAGNADLAAAGATQRLPEEAIIDGMFHQTKTMLLDYRTSMVIDYVLGRPLEVEAILGEPSRRAARLGVPAPTIDALYALVRAADLKRRGLLRALTEADVALPAPVATGPLSG